MARRPVLLIASAVLLAAWLGYVAYLALTTSHPVVLSRPQFLVADVWLIARVDGLDKPVTVVEVVYARPGTEKLEQGAALPVLNLAQCKEGWKNEGRYILPLTWNKDVGYALTPIPHSPGYPPGGFAAAPLRIYPDTPETRAQLDHLPRPKDEPPAE